MRIAHAFVARFARDRSGAVALIFGLSLLVLCFVAGLAIDASRAYSMSSKLGAILDSAALAAAKMLDDGSYTDEQVKAKAQAYFSAHLSGMEIPGLTLNGFVATPDRGASSVAVQVNVSMPTTFGQVAGIPTLDFAKSATVIYKMKKVELAMALDITGSMLDVPPGDTRSKIDSLRLAAKGVVDTVFSEAVNDTNIRIALAPYSASINPGSYTWSVTGGASGFGCVVERPGSANATDQAPTGSSAMPINMSGTTCPTATITPLVGRSQSLTLKSKIDSFSAGGSTAGHIGMAWAWYMLSPSWGGVFSGASAPNPVSASGDVIKVAVIMTDGLFNTSYLTGPAPGSATAVEESYTQFARLCTNMKAQGIQVFTVGFGLNDPRATSELAGCASAAANAFSVTTGTQLNSAFQTIVERLNTLRVTQ